MVWYRDIIVNTRLLLKVCNVGDIAACLDKSKKMYEAVGYFARTKFSR